MTLLALCIAVALGAVHLLIGRVVTLEFEPRSRWLSAAGGVTVAFVFIYLLPELAHFREVLAAHRELAVVDEMSYAVALVGVLVFYALEHLAYRERRPDEGVDPEEPPFGHDYVFWVHIGWYALYNVIIGVLLSYGEQETVVGLVAYGVAMGVHLSVIDAAMRSHHQHVYRMTGRWVLAGAIVVGWVVGAFVAISAAAMAIVTAFLIGAMLIVAIKDELPSGRQTQTVPFIAGAAVATALLWLF